MAEKTLSIGLGGGGESLKNSQAIESQGMIELDIPVGGNATDLEVSLNVDVSQIAMFWMFADGALQIETNAVNAAGGQTIQLGANKNFFWESGSGITNPLTPDITKIYVTNGSATARTLRIRYMYDATP